MPQCYDLAYISAGLAENSSDCYFCKLCGKEFRLDNPRVKYTCKASYAEEYKNAPSIGTENGDPLPRALILQKAHRPTPMDFSIG